MSKVANEPIKKYRTFERKSSEGASLRNRGNFRAFGNLTEVKWNFGILMLRIRLLTDCSTRSRVTDDR